MEAQEKIRSIVLGLFDLEAGELRDDQNLKDVGIDSLMALDILTALEKNFQIKLREQAMRRFTTIESITALVREERLCQASAADMSVVPCLAAVNMKPYAVSAVAEREPEVPSAGASALRISDVVPRTWTRPRRAAAAALRRGSRGAGRSSTTRRKGGG